MYTTSIKVYTGVSPSTSIPNDSSHRISIKNANVLNVQTLREIRVLPPIDINIPFTDCQYVSTNPFIYKDKLEDLVNTVLKGYQSAGIYINDGILNGNNYRLGLIEALINYMNDTLVNVNKARNKDNLPSIIVSVGLVGFCDEYVYDYYSNTKVKHDYDIDSDLILYLHPLKKMNGLLNLIKSIPEKTPSILIIDITDGNYLQSRLAWVDLPSPLSEFSTYKKTIINLIKIMKASNDSHFDGFIGDKNLAMANTLLKFFNGSYRTMVFNHFNEYLPKHDSNNFIDTLQFTSSLQNIKCSITLGQIEKYKNIVEYYRNLAKSQEETEKIQIKCEILAASIKEKLQDSIRLKEREMGFEIVTETLQNTNSISQAAIERERISSDWELAHMREVLRNLKITLVQAEVSRASFEYTQQDIEYELENRQNISKGLMAKRDQFKQHLNQLFESLQQTTNQIRENDRITEEGPSKRELNFSGLYNKWAATENYYDKCFKDCERKINNLKHEKETALLQRQTDTENLKNQYQSVKKTDTSENNKHSTEILNQVENKLKSFGDKIEGTLLKSIELNIERSLASLKGAFDSQQYHHQQQPSFPNVAKNIKDNNNDSLKKVDLFLRQRVNGNLETNYDDDESDDTDGLFVPSSPDKSSPLKRKIKTRRNEISPQTLTSSKRSSTLQLPLTTTQKQQTSSKLSPKPALPSSPKPATPSSPKPILLSSLASPTSPASLASPSETVDNKHNNTLEKNVILQSPLINKLSIEDDNEFKKVIGLSQRRQQLNFETTEKELNEIEKIKYSSLRSLSISPEINKEEVLIKKDHAIRHFSLNNKSVTKSLSADIQNDEEDENLFIPLRPKPPSDIDEEKKQKKKQKKRKQAPKMQYKQPLSSPSSSSHLPSQLSKPIGHKDKEVDEEIYSEADKDASQSSAMVKKKRKLRPNKAIVDDIDMSPVLGGYADKFFNVT